MVAFARQAMADPDWFEKVRTGQGEQVRLCEYTNYCEGLDQKHKQVTCNLWDRVDRDGGCLKSHDGKRTPDRAGVAAAARSRLTRSHSHYAAELPTSQRASL